MASRTRTTSLWLASGQLFTRSRTLSTVLLMSHPVIDAERMRLALFAQEKLPPQLEGHQPMPAEAPLPGTLPPRPPAATAAGDVR